MSKDKELGLCPMEELLPYTMHMMETLWDMPDDKKKEVINLADARMAKLLQKKLQDHYGTLYDVIKGEK